ncbi:DsbA family protein [Bartonella doshiae]|uniref:Thiol-disulfide oxidoreductase D n=2 Tax=Bartonella doshiae TaxID=33044 RepID=A0A380ZC73_BARDO|nr:DsbA family protein [Bartonella doshiae]EJF81985.1 hypothetical protein MCS_00410 [Bartonella doshiae NCTC 12862 = ATCC 700133]MBB6158980.1 protein-disulfide isomerase [Bartonella doshiae]SUV44589.1 Thiol-disulfide oxidoreductase D [Bartonella doshiae]
MINHRSFLPFAIIFLLMTIVSISISNVLAGGAKPISTIDMTVDMDEVLKAGKVKDRVEGEENAPVTIVEYASLTCTHCANFYNDVLPQIRKKYIKTGKVRFIFREYAFDARATAGFMLARCAPEDRYFPLIEILFQKQNEWVFVKDAVTPLKKISLMAGFTDESFKACLKNQSILEEVNASFERGRELGVTGTPTFFINGKMHEGVMSVESFFSVIDSFLKK